MRRPTPRWSGQRGLDNHGHHTSCAVTLADAKQLLEHDQTHWIGSLWKDVVRSHACALVVRRSVCMRGLRRETYVCCALPEDVLGVSSAADLLQPSGAKRT